MLGNLSSLKLQLCGNLPLFMSYVDNGDRSNFSAVHFLTAESSLCFILEEEIYADKGLVLWI